MTVPYSFANATVSIPLSQLDANFNTPITLGNTAIQLGNTVTTLNNMTLANVTISSGNVTITNVSVTTANVTTANITNMVSGNVTITGGSINGTTLGATTASTANVTTLTTSSTVTINGGTANGVAYLNGSKVLTTGSALTFDGSYFTAASGTGTFLADIVQVSGTATKVNANGVGLEFRGGSNPNIASYSRVGSAYLPMTLDTSASIFSISGTEAMRLTSTGLGIGTSSPSERLEVVGVVKIRTSGGSGVQVVSAATPYIQAFGASGNNTLQLNGQSISFWSGASYGAESERMRLDASGNLGLGVQPSAWGSSYKAIEFPGFSIANLNGGTNQQAQYLLNAYDSGTGTWIYKISSVAAAMYRQSAGAHEWHTAPSGTAGNTISFTQAMTLSVTGANSNNTTLNLRGGAGGGGDVAKIDFERDGTGVLGTIQLQRDGGNGAGALQFFTNNGSSNSERARITSGGDLLVGTTDAALTTGNGIKLLAGTAAGENLVINSSASTNANEGFMMYSTGAGAYRFYVQWDGKINATNTTIAGISDARLKENIQDLDVGLDKIMALKPRKFDWKAGKGKDIKGDRGFIAQEFEQVFPDLIDEWKDPAPEGEEPYKSVRADLIPVLVKAIQELKAQNDDLRARVAQLEAK
jgi:hypothetical protein